MGLVYHSLNDNKKALEYLKRSEDIMKEYYF